MKAQIMYFFWKLFLPKDEVEKKAKDLVAKEIDYRIRKTSPGGVYITFKQKVVIFFLLVLAIGVSFAYFMLIIFSASH